MPASVYAAVIHLLQVETVRSRIASHARMLRQAGAGCGRSDRDCPMNRGWRAQ